MFHFLTVVTSLQTTTQLICNLFNYIYLVYTVCEWSRRRPAHLLSKRAIASRGPIREHSRSTAPPEDHKSQLGEISIISREEGSACGGLSSEFRKQVEEEGNKNLPACQVREGMQAARRPPPKACSPATSSGQIREQRAGVAHLFDKIEFKWTKLNIQVQAAFINDSVFAKSFEEKTLVEKILFQLVCDGVSIIFHECEKMTSAGVSRGSVFLLPGPFWDLSVR